MVGHNWYLSESSLCTIDVSYDDAGDEEPDHDASSVAVVTITVVVISLVSHKVMSGQKLFQWTLHQLCLL